METYLNSNKQTNKKPSNLHKSSESLIKIHCISAIYLKVQLQSRLVENCTWAPISLTQLEIKVTPTDESFFL